MPWSITVGSIGGTAIRIHITFLLFLVWIGVSAFAKGGAEVATQNVIFIILLFGCVVLHEFGHILMARRFGIRTPEVTLLPIGGVASLERMPEKPSQELAVALAGPLVNIVIAVILVAVGGAVIDNDLSHVDDPKLTLVTRLAATNIFLAVFNMIPAFPMDGGRVLRAILAMNMEPKRATQAAARVGQALAFLLGFLGLFGNPILLFIAIFVFLAATGEAQESALRSAVVGLTVSDAMETRVCSIGMDATLADAIDVLLSTPQHEFPIVDAHGKPSGILVRDDLIAGLRERSREASVVEVMRSPLTTVRSSQALDKALAELSASGSPAISVVDADGVLVGMLTRENIGEMMMIKAVQPDWVFPHRA